MVDARPRLKAAKRLLALQGDIRRVEEAKLAQIERQKAAVAQAQLELVGALAADTPLHGLFVDTMAQRLRRLAGEATLLDRASETQTQSVRQATARDKAAQRLTDDLARDVAREDEARDLAAVIEQAIARASLP